ncbi:hypothetical protein F5883DRAFT_596317, partial [Diaporthe sp. PMI_573]
FIESHNVQNDPTCAGKGSVLDAMRDLDFEWDGSNDFSSQTNTSMRSFSETSTLGPLPLGISLQSSYLGIIIPNGGNLHSGKRSIVNQKADSDSDTSPSTQPSSTRGRRPSHVGPGSARAICLKKNRKAAKKCRSKQKKKQQGALRKADHLATIGSLSPVMMKSEKSQNAARRRTEMGPGCTID